MSNNNGDERDGERREFAFILLVPILGLSFLPITGSLATLPDANALGTWVNMPSNPTELMGNMSYRSLIITRSSTGEGGLGIGLIVNCLNPSNTIGANLQLQYANYSDTTHTNSSNFLDPSNGIGGHILIDNSANNPCPGRIDSPTFALPAINVNPTIFEIRVIGSGGGGIGDNPRFAIVAAYIIQSMNKFFDTVVSSRSTTAFTAFAYVIGPAVSNSVTVNFDWVATNNFVAGESNSNSCVINAGTTSCSVTTTFPIAFATTPNVVTTTRTPAAAYSILAGIINLLQAQTVTV
jgi:hypothetical protein